MSGTVTSHANGLPFAQSSSVTSSGRLHRYDSDLQAPSQLVELCSLECRHKMSSSAALTLMSWTCQATKLLLLLRVLSTFQWRRFILTAASPYRLLAGIRVYDIRNVFSRFRNTDSVMSLSRRKVQLVYM